MISCSSSNGRAMLLAGIAIGAMLPGAAIAQAVPAAAKPAASDGEIIVTATRRDTTIQNAPINISAVGGDQIAKQGLTNLRELSQAIPGVYIADTGARNGQPIVFRGLNANPLNSGDGNNDGGGTVATYIGEIPLYVDLRPVDMQRVEFLAGPQGTLYGAGTLGGAIRYIPNRPQFDEFSLDLRGESYVYDKGTKPSFDGGATINVPISSTLAFRASFDQLHDVGFINQPYVVNQIGVSNPDPNFNDPRDVAANTHPVKGVNNVYTTSARAALRWQPTSTLDVNLTYYFQDQNTNGRQASGAVVSDFPVAVGNYENLKRVLEPNTRINQLLSLEVTADLGFANLTSATGRSWFRDFGNRDQTDLLIGLEYGYESFPNFTAYTEEKDHTNTFTQEVRLVSKGASKFNWIVGAFYNKQDANGYSKEFTPGYSEYLVSSDPASYVQTRPDNLEYYSVGSSKLEELAGYGELSYEVIPGLTLTAGGRYYHYNLKTRNAVDLPLYDTVTGGRNQTDIILNPVPGGQKDSGFLYKFNASYKASDDLLFYATASQGYRIGNSNGVVPCVMTGMQQNVCGQPNELAYRPDKTNNYEIGVKSQWFDRRLTANVSVYYIKWIDPQVASATQIGLQPITVNGSGARTQGAELSLSARPTDRLTLRATYAYTDAKLTALSPHLVPFITAPGFQQTVQYADGQAGDRLPGSPRHSGSFSAEYTVPMGDERALAFNYTLTGQSNVLTTTGALGNSYTLPGFTRSNISARYSADDWSVTLYCDNLFNAFSQTGVDGSPNFNQQVFDSNGGVHTVRTFYTFVQPPRQIGIRFTKRFRS